MTSKAYIYQPLPADPGSIRLLRALPSQADDAMRCELTVSNVNTSEYKALSYVWGPPHETFQIRLNEKSWSVRKSLRNFLRKVQDDYTNQPLWIDALCINQYVIPERNQQVSQMGQIYSRAKLVLVWLEDDLSSFELFSYFSVDGDWTGPVTAHEKVSDPENTKEMPGNDRLCKWAGWEDPEEPEINAMPPLDSDFDFLEPWSESDKQTARTVFTEISRHPFWTRSWVVQEFCLAKNVLFVFRSVEMSFLKFERAFLLTDPDDADNESAKAMKGISELVFWRQGVYQAVSGETKQRHPTDLHELLVTFGARNCQDVRDRVFSLIGISEESTDFQIDYGQNKLQLFLSVLHFSVTKGRKRFYTAIRLIELLDLSLSEITSNLRDLPSLSITYDLASGFLVVNGTGGITRSYQLWTCQCHQCHELEQLSHPRRQMILVRTPLPSLWLLYSFREWRTTDNNGPCESEACLKFMACAAPIHNDRDVGQKLCAFVPEHPLLKLYHDSQLSLKDDGRDLMKVHLNERSIFAEAFCASLLGSASASHFAHSSMVMPVEAKSSKHGPLCVVHYEWDWARYGISKSDHKSTTRVVRRSVGQSR